MDARRAASAFRQKVESTGKFRETWDALCESFKSWDTNGDGMLDIDEFHYGCGIHAIPMSKAEAEEIFTALDDDGNGMLDFEEFDVLVRKEGKKAAVSKFKQHFEGMGRHDLSKLEEIFVKFDTNQNGTVDKLEFRLGAEQVFSSTLSEEDVDEMWDKFELQPDEELKMQEFVDLMKVSFEAEVLDKFRGKAGFGGAALAETEAAIEEGVRLERSDSVDEDEDLRMQGDIEMVREVNVKRRASQMGKGRLQELLDILCRAIGKTRAGAKRYEMELAADTLGWSNYASRRLHALYLRLGPPLQEYATRYGQSPVATMGFKLGQLGGYIDKDPDRPRLTTELIVAEQPSSVDDSFATSVSQRDVNALLEEAGIRFDKPDLAALYAVFGSPADGSLSAQALYDIIDEIYSSHVNRLQAENRVTESLYLDIMMEVYAQIIGMNDTPIDWEVWADEARDLIAKDWAQTRRKIKQRRKTKEAELTSYVNGSPADMQRVQQLLTGLKQEINQLAEEERGMDASLRVPGGSMTRRTKKRERGSTFASRTKRAEELEYMSLDRFKESVFGVIDMWTETMQVAEYAALLCEILNRADEQTSGRFGPANYVTVRAIEPEEPPYEMPIVMYEIDKTDLELAVDTAMEAARLAAADAAEIAKLMALIDGIILEAAREARRASMQRNSIIVRADMMSPHASSGRAPSSRLEKLKQELRRKQEATMGWDVYYERPDRLNPLYILGYKHMYRAPAVELLHQQEMDRKRDAAKRAAEAAMAAAAFARAQYEKMYAMLREMLEEERRRQEAVRRAAADAAAAALAAAEFAQTAAENALIACRSLDVVRQRIYEASLVAARAATDAKLIAEQALQFMNAMKNSFEKSLEVVQLEMEKSLRRKKKRLRAKKSYESQLQQQRSLLAAATSDQDRKRISERIQSLTRLWKRKQQIWWSEDQAWMANSMLRGKRSALGVHVPTADLEYDRHQHWVDTLREQGCSQQDWAQSEVERLRDLFKKEQGAGGVEQDPWTAESPTSRDHNKAALVSRASEEAGPEDGHQSPDNEFSSMGLAILRQHAEAHEGNSDGPTQMKTTTPGVGHSGGTRGLNMGVKWGKERAAYGSNRNQDLPVCGSGEGRTYPSLQVDIERRHRHRRSQDTVNARTRAVKIDRRELPTRRPVSACAGRIEHRQSPKGFCRPSSALVQSLERGDKLRYEIRRTSKRGTLPGEEKAAATAALAVASLYTDTPSHSSWLASGGTLTKGGSPSRVASARTVCGAWRARQGAWTYSSTVGTGANGGPVAPVHGPTHPRLKPTLQHMRIQEWCDKNGRHGNSVDFGADGATAAAAAAAAAAARIALTASAGASRTASAVTATKLEHQLTGRQRAQRARQLFRTTPAWMHGKVVHTQRRWFQDLNLNAGLSAGKVRTLGGGWWPVQGQGAQVKAG